MKRAAQTRPRRPAPRLAAQIAETAQVGFILPGTLTERMTRCGYPRCRCHADPPLLHGPYHQWTRKINGKTVTRILTDDQIADYKPGSTTSAASAKLIAELETLSQESTDNDPRWNRRDPAGVGSTRLTCRRTARQTPLAQVIAKRENLTRSGPRPLDVTCRG